MRQLENTFKILSSDCDRYGFMKMNRILVIMQELAGEHSDLLGWSFKNTLRHGAVWVVIRNEFEVIQYPAIGQAVVGKTFPGRPRRGIYPRYYRIEDQAGRPLILGSSFWALADVNTRQMTDLPEVAAGFPDTGDLAPYFHNPGAPDSLEEGSAREEVWHPVFTDLDRNGHVNNTRAAEWALCYLSETSNIEDHPVRSVIASYHKELYEGQPVDMAFTAKDRAFSMLCSVGGEAALKMSGTLFEEKMPMP